MRSLPFGFKISIFTIIGLFVLSLSPSRAQTRFTPEEVEEVNRRIRDAPKPSYYTNSEKKTAPAPPPAKINPDPAYNSTLAFIEQKYPALNPDSPQYNKIAEGRVIAKMQGYEKQGYIKSSALRLAVKDVFPDEPNTNTGATYVNSERQPATQKNHPSDQDKIIEKGIRGLLTGLVVFPLLYFFVFIVKKILKGAKQAFNKSKSVAQHAIDQSSIVGMHTNRHDHFYETALAEIESENYDKATLAKAIAISDGDGKRKDAEYIKLRVKKLASET